MKVTKRLVRDAGPLPPLRDLNLTAPEPAAEPTLQHTQTGLLPSPHQRCRAPRFPRSAVAILAGLMTSSPIKEIFVFFLDRQTPPIRNGSHQTHHTENHIHASIQPFSASKTFILFALHTVGYDGLKNLISRAKLRAARAHVRWQTQVASRRRERQTPPSLAHMH